MDTTDLKKLPENMLGAMSKREHESLFLQEAKQQTEDAKQDGDEEIDELDTGLEWDTEIDIEKEKERCLQMLSKFVAHSEVFFNHH